jgi:outer membrane protein assembly factor BamB
VIRRLASLLICLILVSAISPALGDHLTFRGDAQRSGNVSATGPDRSDLLWSEKLTARGYIGGSAAVYGDRIYVSSWPDMSYKGEQALSCLNAEDGSVLWLNPLGGKGGVSTPAVSDDLVFAGSWYGDLYCLDADTGETVWNRTVEKDPQWWGGGLFASGDRGYDICDHFLRGNPSRPGP